MAKEEISTTQLMMLVVISRITVALVYFPAMGNPELKQDVWLAAFAGSLLGIPFVWLLTRLWTLFPEKSFAQVTELVLGKVVGKVVVLLYWLFMLKGASTNLRLTAEFYISAFLPRTPLIVVLGVVGFLSVWSARAGIEVMGRAGQVIFPLALGSVLAIFLLLLKDMEFRALQPVLLQSGPGPLFREMVNVVARNTEYAWLGMTVPFLNRPPGIFRAVAIAHLWQAVIGALLAIAVTGVLGQVQHLLYFPFFSAARMVAVADFLERIDAVVLSVWFFGMFLRIALFLWAAAVGAAQWVGVKDYRPLVIPLGGIAVSYAVAQVESFSQLRGHLAPATFTPYTLTMTWVIPMLVLVVAMFRSMTRGMARLQER